MSQEAHLTLYSPEPLSPLAFPFADEGIKAGFPSPAQDYMEERIDLNRIVVRSPETTFYARVSGSSLRDAGILDGDIVVIDKSLAPRDATTSRLAWMASSRSSNFVGAKGKTALGSCRQTPPTSRYA